MHIASYCRADNWSKNTFDVFIAALISSGRYSGVEVQPTSTRANATKTSTALERMRSIMLQNQRVRH